ncbi:MULTISPECIES: hypothetical protein [Flavobacteriaceae]|jgi:hypothetical protein|uniref:hypothetical protein n=1 Tax=Flavobacteriaceae TaxID=49546 RepID=UPI0005938517|nr:MULTISPECIES: hypothetical protein [Flavobacteriaceae]
MPEFLLLLMIFGKAFAIWKICGLLVIRVRAIYRTELISNTPMIIPKLNEKMMMSSEARMETIIIAKRDMGSPKMTARFLMFL